MTTIYAIRDTVSGLFQITTHKTLGTLPQAFFCRTQENAEKRYKDAVLSRRLYGKLIHEKGAVEYDHCSQEWIDYHLNCDLDDENCNLEIVPVELQPGVAYRPHVEIDDKWPF